MWAPEAEAKGPLRRSRLWHPSQPRGAPGPPYQRPPRPTSDTPRERLGANPLRRRALACLHRARPQAEGAVRQVDCGPSRFSLPAAGTAMLHGAATGFLKQSLSPLGFQPRERRKLTLMWPNALEEGVEPSP